MKKHQRGEGRTQLVLQRIVSGLKGAKRTNTTSRTTSVQLPRAFVRKNIRRNSRNLVPAGRGEKGEIGGREGFGKRVDPLLTTIKLLDAKVQFPQKGGTKEKRGLTNLGGKGEYGES